jgi:iron(III) transport system permease protein
MSAAAVARRAYRQLPSTVTALVVAGLVLLPIVPLQAEALADGGRGFEALRDYDALWDVVSDTLVLGVGSTVFALVFGTALALAVNSMRPRSRSLAAVLPVLPLLIPGSAHVVGFIFLFSPEVGYVNKVLRLIPVIDGSNSGPLNIYSFGWIVAYTGFHLAALVYLFVYNGLTQLGGSAVAAARANGASARRTLFTVTLPMLRPVLLYAATIVFLLSLGQLTGPLFLGRRDNVQVVATEMYRFTQEAPVQFALGAALGSPLLVVAVVLILVQRRLLRSQERYVGSTARDHIELRYSTKGQFAAWSLVGIYTALSAILPILALLHVATSRFWSGELDLSDRTSENLTRVWNDPAVRSSIGTTIRVAVMAAVIASILGFAVSFVLFQRHRHSGIVSAVLDVSVTVTLAVPAALIGFGFLFAYRDLGWYGTPFGLVLAFTVIALPFAVRYQLAGLISMGQLPVEASVTSGARMTRCWRSVVLPLIRSSIAAAAAIILVLLTHEFGTAAMLRSPRTTVMSVKLYDFFSGGLYPQVAAMGLLMTAVTAIVVIAALVSGAARPMRRGN